MKGNLQMTTETELTPEQRKALEKLGLKFLAKSLLTGAHHALMLVVMNFITTTFVVLTQLPEFTMYIFSAAVAIFVFKRMFSITKENHDRLILEAKKIVEPK